MLERLLDRAPKEMRVGLGQFREPSDDMLTYIVQLGAQDFLMNTASFPGDKQWEYEDLAAAVKKAEKHGLRLMALENVPITFYDKVMRGEPGRDEQIAHMQNTIRNMGRAGIPIFGYHWAIDGVWRTSNTALARGGAKVTAFDYAEVENAPLTHGRPYSDEEIWANYTYYIQAILPVAEEAGVHLALHPDDPPVPQLAGVARIMRNFENFKRAMEIGNSPNHGLDFCVGSWSEMDPNVVLPAIRHFGSQGKIFYVHFRDVLGSVPKFREAFINEGNLDMFEVMKTLKEVGFNGFLLDDHVPMMSNDSGWNNRSRSFALGQMSVMLDMVNRQ
jgi:mannonate dehydratase